MKCITHTSVTGEILYYCKKLSTFKEVQLVQTQHHGAKLHKRATYGQKFQYTYISQKQSFYKIELRCDFNYEMHRALVRYRKTTVLQQKIFE